MSAYFTDIIDVVSDICRETAGMEMTVVGNPRTHGWKGYSFSPLGQMNHHTGPGRWVPLLNFMHHGSSIAPLCGGATSNPYETDGKLIVAILACGRANHAGKGSWYPDVPVDDGNRLLWGWEHQHPGDASPWHPLHREGILRLNVGTNLAFGWKAFNVPDHKDYAPKRKIDRAGENGVQWRGLIQQRMNVGHHSGHVPEVRKVAAGRIAGQDRFESAARMMREAYAQDEGRTVYVATTESSEERLSGHMRGPVALVTRDAVPAATKALIEHYRPSRVLALGGPNTVPKAVLDQCQRIAERA